MPGKEDEPALKPLERKRMSKRMTNAFLLYLNELRVKLKKWDFFFIYRVNLGGGFESNPLLIVNQRKDVNRISANGKTPSLLMI